MKFIALEQLLNLYDGYSRSFRVGHDEFLLCQEGGATYLVSAICPHQGASLEHATLFSHDQRAAIRCPRHGLSFALDNGELIASSAKPEGLSCSRLPCFELDYHGNQIGIWQQ
jgi:nitrite reductase/ring-hydroxylating ferredoxin subunit